MATLVKDPKTGGYKELDDLKPIQKDPDDENQTFLTEMRDRFERCLDFDRDLRIKWLEDVKFTFVPGNQWDTYTSGLRADRPCYEINKVRQSIRQITGDQLQNPIGAKVRPAEDGEADEDTAEIYEGLIRNIEAISHAEHAYDVGFNYAVSGGYGVWRITTDYRDDEDFDQDLFVKPVDNPLCAYCDPDAKEFTRSDAKFWFLKSRMSKLAYQDKYPKAELESFFGDGIDERMLSWVDGDDVIICEYWYKKPYKKTIVQMSDGTVVDAESYEKDAKLYSQQQPPITEKQRKTIDCEKVYMEIVSGTQRLEGPYEWAGKNIPLIPVWGDIINIEGRDIWSGATRFAKDSQRLFNFSESTKLEVMANQPQQPLTGPVEAITGLETYYNSLSDANVPFLPYNLVPGAPNGGRPERVGGTQFPAAWAQLSAEQSDNIKATLGIYDASLGARSNETSGRAINARKNQGDVANFVYKDNLAKARKYTYELLVDLIPKIYDTERVLRILGKDGADKWVRVNHGMIDPQTGPVVVNDLNKGKYTVTVTTGPSFTTQRQELADAAMQLSNNPGPFGLIWQYIFVASSDLPGAQEATEWMRQFLVKQGLAPPDQNTPPPPPQAPPDPSVVAKVNLMGAQQELVHAQTQKTLTEAQKAAALTPSEIAKNSAQSQEQQAKAVRNVAETHHGIIDHTLQTALPGADIFKENRAPVYNDQPNPTPFNPNAGTY